MSALKTELHAATAAITNHPYPSWSEMADTVGLRARIVAQDQQARKEARIWRELAEEPRGGDAHPSSAKRA